MINQIVAALLSFAVAALGTYAGYRRGQTIAARRFKAEVDATVAEWTRRADAGDVMRAVELPGLHVLRSMLQ